ncbi:MAG: bifunctional salicylyl-CoA 5-hydroxylase/oxidoreductase [Xanthomonadales bacterium]
MKIVCVGGGPAGLYLAISMMLRSPDHEITVIERNRPDDTFGWGVVFSDEVVANLAKNDWQSAEKVTDGFIHWDGIDVHYKGETITSGGHGFCGIGRQHLLNILYTRAGELGVKLVFETEVEPDLEQFADYDLVIASDGINSRFREAYKEHLDVDIDVRPNKFIWLGTNKLFDAFTFIFKETRAGWIWVHAYCFDKNTSTFIVECQESTWQVLGLGEMSQEECSRYLEDLFSEHLDGNALMSNAKHIRGSAWISFPRVLCGQWHYRNLVLIGDAAHTAHFSIGSGTRLGFEDAIDLADALNSSTDIDQALEEYREKRTIEVLRLQSAARNSMQWFENLPRYTDLEPMQFNYALLTRSQRVSHENLRLRDPAWLESMERWFSKQATTESRVGGKTVPPMFVPFKLRDMVLKNRVVVSPMAMYSAEDGTPGDFHLVHLGARAQGGAGLIMTEMVCVSSEARITLGCAGLYNDEHIEPWKRIVDFVHSNDAVKICLQLGHSGPKGATKLLWEGMDEPLEEGAWELMAPSPIPWTPENQVPREMTRGDMDCVCDEFKRAAVRAEICGFDMIEMHFAHGYLISSFLTPLKNQRSDEYGGSLENRLRYPLEVFSAVRKVWPQHKPMSVRISATDWVEGGLVGDDAVQIARAFVDSGVDIVDVSAGQTSEDANPVYGRMFQTPLSDQVRQEAGVATMAVGNIYETDHVNGIIAAGRADLCCLARPHLADPYWTLHAAAQLGYEGEEWPVQYLAGRNQYARNLARAAEMVINA